MITYTEIKQHKDLPFDEYLKLGGHSHSFLKSQINGVSPYFKVTDKVRLGSLVDALLTQEDRFDFGDPLASKAMEISLNIKNVFGTMIKNFKPQISYTANLNFSGFSLKSTGRLDWELPNIAVIDLKVTGAKSDKEFREYINHMGYKNQLWHYAKMANVNKAYILPFSVTANKCLSIVSIPVGDRNEFWEQSILKFGSCD